MRDVLAALAPFRDKAGRDIPVFVAGGVKNGADMARYMKEGAAGAQFATRFIATAECDASNGYKQHLLDASPTDITLVKSPVGMPGRALRSPLIRRVEDGIQPPPERCIKCITTCDGKNAPYCISRGPHRRTERGLGKRPVFLRGQRRSSQYPFHRAGADGPDHGRMEKRTMKLGFLYAGQGSQHPGMGADLYKAFSAFRKVLDSAGQKVDFDLKDVSFTDAAGVLNQTRYTQPCMVAFAAGLTPCRPRNMEKDNIRRSRTALRQPRPDRRSRYIVRRSCPRIPNADKNSWKKYIDIPACRRSFRICRRRKRRYRSLWPNRKPEPGRIRRKRTFRRSFRRRRPVRRDRR